MKTVMSNKLTKVVCISLILLGLTSPAFAYPPGNAVVLYYKACLLYEPQESMRDMIDDYARGETELTEEIADFVKKNENIIDIIVDAADIQNCNWGLDYSEGLELLIPGLSDLKHISRLVTADARIITSEGDYELALERCLTSYEMAGHVSDLTLISWLVGYTINMTTDKCIQNILSTMPEDLETLQRLKSKLSLIQPFPFVKICISSEFEMIRLYMMQIEYKDMIISGEEQFDLSDEKKSMLELLRNADEEFFAKNRAYNETIENSVIDAFGLPYPQAYNTIGKLINEKIINDVESGNPDAVLTAILTPALAKCYSLGIRKESGYNALRAAVAIYILKATTGQLPDAIPAGLPKDMFSGKDFIYEKNADGFILRCQGKELPKNKIHEYEFNVTE